MAGIDRQVFGQGGELAQGAGQGAGVAAGQVGAAGGAAEQRVAGEQGVVVLEFPADAAGGVAGGFDDRPARPGEFEDVAFLDEDEGALGFIGGVVEAGEVVLVGKAPRGVPRMDVDGGGTGGGEGGEG